MGYIRAEEILPKELIEMIQQYADGVSIYVPKKKTETTGERRKQSENRNAGRDRQIYSEYLEGIGVNALAEKYYLSDKSIWRIIRNMKN